MNRKRLEELAAALDKAEYLDPDEAEWSSTREEYLVEPITYFNQGVWLMNRDNYNCDTVGCIAGWAVSLFGESTFDETTRYMTIDDRAKELLGLSRIEANELFDSHADRPGLHDITPKQAAQAVRNLLAGKQDIWQ